MPPEDASASTSGHGGVASSDVLPALAESTFQALIGAGETARQTVQDRVRRAAPLLSGAQVREVTDVVVARFDGYGRISALLERDGVSEVMVNGGAVWVEHDGRLQRTDVQLDRTELQRLIERLVGPAGARVDRASPIVDLRLPDGSRANIVLPPLSPDGPCVTIRRFVLRRATLADFAAPAVADLLVAAVRGRANLVVSGGTGSGKTTLLNAMAGHIAGGERIVTIEDTAELRLDHPHVVRLEGRQANTEGVGLVSIRTLVRTALRMRPDRILVGEARGGEVMDVLQAMNTGHEGSMSTCHANSPRDALRRLEALALLSESDLSPAFVRDQIASALQLVVHVRRHDGGRRVISDVVAVGPHADWNTGNDLTPMVQHGAVLCDGEDSATGSPRGSQP